METGHVFWAVPLPGMSIRSRVFVAWDYTKDCPAGILLKQEGNEDTMTEVDIFSIPVIERLSILDFDIFDISLSDIFSTTVDEADDSDDSGLLMSSQNLS
jgi:hypothetical protein